MFFFSAMWRQTYGSALSSPGSDSGYSDHAEALMGASKIGYERTQQNMKFTPSEAEVSFNK